MSCKIAQNNINHSSKYFYKKESSMQEKDFINIF